MLQAGGRGLTEKNCLIVVQELTKFPPFVNAELEWIQVYLWERFH